MCLCVGQCGVVSFRDLDQTGYGKAKLSILLSGTVVRLRRGRANFSYRRDERLIPFFQDVFDSSIDLLICIKMLWLESYAQPVKRALRIPRVFIGAS